ncbi:MAG: MotA/TolQ/ExbB proton channel family protein [Gammaproteobacteria bacterium]|nr:MotA/TolQ/ExbB proton channel family protein [Gammaproteobacteria bacterium]
MTISFVALGPLAYPLLICSFIALMLIIERGIFYISWRSPMSTKQAVALVRLERARLICNEILPTSDRLLTSISLLVKHSDKKRELREEIANHWLSVQRNELFNNLGWLTLLAVISPMLGLLGTVIGIIKVFSAISMHTGPIFPAMLADGLGQAMLTTAAGLTIALPTLIAIHALRIFANNRLTRLSETLNCVNLLLDDVDMDQSNSLIHHAPTQQERTA